VGYLQGMLERCEGVRTRDVPRGTFHAVHPSKADASIVTLSQLQVSCVRRSSGRFNHASVSSGRFIRDLVAIGGRGSLRERGIG